jgi:hypothetical protein
MGSETGNSSRNAERQANTAELMSNIMAPGAGEISKKREKELQDAANFGRGVQFVPGDPYVGGENVFRIDPATGEKKRVMRTGTTAADFTGNIIANKPTMGEFFGDIGRGLFGGQADAPQFNLPVKPPASTTPQANALVPSLVSSGDANFANMLRAPERTQGLIPNVINTGGIMGLLMNTGKDILGKGKDIFGPAIPDPVPTGNIFDLFRGTGNQQPVSVVPEAVAMPQQTVGIESIADATDAPAFKDLTPQDILEQPLESINDIVSSFKKNAILDELIIDELNKEAGERDLDFVNNIINQNQYRDYQQYLQDYPDLRKNLFLGSEPFDRRRTADSYIRR